MSTPQVPGRHLRITLKRNPWVNAVGSRPIITVNGSPVPGSWGENSTIIPATSTQIGVYLDQYPRQYGLAEYLLSADESAELEYKAPAIAYGPGSLGRPGTVRRRALWFPIVILGLLGFAVLGLIVVIIVTFD